MRIETDVIEFKEWDNSSTVNSERVREKMARCLSAGLLLPEEVRQVEKVMGRLKRRSLS